MKTTIKNAVAELLPSFLAQSLESDYPPAERTTDADGKVHIQDLDLPIHSLFTCTYPFSQEK